MKIFNGKKEHEIIGIERDPFTNGVMRKPDYREFRQFCKEQLELRAKMRTIPISDAQKLDVVKRCRHKQ